MSDSVLIVLFAIVGGALRVSTPFMFVALGECLTEKSGRVNLGLEGTLVLGAMAAYAISYHSGSPWLGVLAAGCAGSVLGAMHGYICKLPKVNDIAIGIAFMSFGTGLAFFFGKPFIQPQAPHLAGIHLGHAHFALRMALREFDLLLKNGMSEEDFQATRVFLRSYIKLYAQSPADQLGWLMDSRFYGRNNYLQELDKLLRRLKLDDVNAALRRHWQTDNLYVTIVTDVSEAEPLAKNLRENLTSPMSYSNLMKSGLSKEVLDEDEVVARYKLNVKSVRIVPSAETFK